MEQKKSDFLIILLSSLLIISCFIAGFFAYQTQRLVAELRIKNEELIIKTPIPTPTTDPTADWKTYTNEKFTFNHPLCWINDGSKFTENCARQKFDWLNVSYKITLDQSRLPKCKTPMLDEPNSFPCLSDRLKPVTETNSFAVCFGVFEACYIYIQYPQKNTELQFYGVDSDLIDQILSTFKFIEPEASSTPLPIACTMEAKICPDGSSVGRAGPKCEFAPCPSPKP